MNRLPIQRAQFVGVVLLGFTLLAAAAWAQSGTAATLLPHGYCISGSPALLWLHVMSDSLIALAYLCIPFLLIRFVRLRRDIPYGWMGRMFGLFIVACGLTHVMGVWTIWEPVYWYSGMVKVVTAVASLGTAWALWRLLPVAIALPSAAALRSLNEALEREVSQRRRAETELQAAKHELTLRLQTTQASNVDLQQFASVASHDLRAPLRSVTGLLSLLQARYGAALDAAGQDLVGRAKRAVVQMDRLTDGLLSYARLDAEDEPRVPVDCNVALADALMLLETPIAEAGARIDIQTLPTVVANAQQMTRLLQNLVGNAIKYCETTPQIRISAERSNATGAAGDVGAGWTFSVQDNGIGIAPEFREHVFKMFERLHTVHVREGTGMGLSICQRIVDGHGGRIWVESAAGGGSILRFTIPDSKA
jgi:signal transduction histidine kinase